MDKGDLKDEYLDASDNIRHWNTLRFAELTVYFALTSGLLNIMIGKSPGLAPAPSALVKLVGLLVTVVFFVLHERTMLYWYNFVRRAAELEVELGFRQYSSRPHAGVVTGTNAVRLLFLTLVLFWVISLFWFPF